MTHSGILKILIIRVVLFCTMGALSCHLEYCTSTSYYGNINERFPTAKQFCVLLLSHWTNKKQWCCPHIGECCPHIGKCCPHIGKCRLFHIKLLLLRQPPISGKEGITDCYLGLLASSAVLVMQGGCTAIGGRNNSNVYFLYSASPTNPLLMALYNGNTPV